MTEIQKLDLAAYRQLRDDIAHTLDATDVRDVERLMDSGLIDLPAKDRRSPQEALELVLATYDERRAAIERSGWRPINELAEIIAQHHNALQRDLRTEGMHAELKPSLINLAAVAILALEEIQRWEQQ